jgi:hypothetical protein
VLVVDDSSGNEPFGGNDSRNDVFESCFPCIPSASCFVQSAAFNSDDGYQDTSISINAEARAEVALNDAVDFIQITVPHAASSIIPHLATQICPSSRES